MFDNRKNFHLPNHVTTSRVRDQGSHEMYETSYLHALLLILIFSIHLLYKKRKRKRKVNYLSSLLFKYTNFSYILLFVRILPASNRSIIVIIRHDRIQKRDDLVIIVGGLKGWSCARHGRKSSPAKRRAGGRGGREGGRGGSFRSKANRSAPWSSAARHKDPPRRCPDLKTSRLSLSPLRLRI